MKLVSLACSLLLAAGAPARPPAKTPKPADVISGRAVSGGRPVPRARIFLFWAEETSRGWRETASGPAGEFRFAIKPTPRQHLALVGVAPSGEIGWSALQIAGTSRLKPGVAQLALKPAATLSGRVVTGEGAGVPGAPVRLAGVRPAGDWPPGAEGLPPALQSGLTAVTAADGSFRLSGVPSPALVALAHGDAEPVQVAVLAPEQAVGVLVQDARAALRLRARPAGPATVWVRPLRAPAPNPLAAILRRRSGTEVGFLPIDLDAQGSAEHRLPPGRYEVGFQGRFQQIQVGAFQELRLEGARPPLKGTLKDESGRPAAGARVSVTTESGAAWPPAGEPIASGADGSFEIADFAWQSPRVTLRASLGASEAVWTGDPRSLEGPLQLTLKKAPTLRARGRLLYEGKPLLGARVALFVREGGARRGFAAGKADATGHFELPGVPTGSVFQVGTVLDALPGEVLESAPVTAPASGEAFELGDVTVGPAQDTGGTAVQARHYLPIPRPSASQEEAAREAFFRYLEALRGGDLPGLHSLTSALDPSHDPQLPAFLRSARLVLPGSLAALRREEVEPVRYYPGVLLAGMYDAGADVGLEELSAAMHRPDWVLLATRSGTVVRRVALMHREAGGWKLLGGLPVDGAGALSAVAGDHPLFQAPFPAAPAEAVTAGDAFLKAWASGGTEKLRPLLSNRAPEKPGDQNGFSERWAARMVAQPPSAATAPSPEGALTEWDVALLFSYPQALRYLLSGAQGEAPKQDLGSFPYPQLRARDLAVLGYAAAEGRFLMLLVRENGQWRVLEPALPVGPGSMS